MWVCKHCYQENIGRGNVCEHCGRARNKLPAASTGKQAPRVEEIPYKRPAEDAPKAEPTELPKVQPAEKSEPPKEKKDKDYIQLGFLRISPSMLLLFFVLSLCVYVLDSGEESSGDAKPGTAEIAAQEESFYGDYSPASDGSRITVDAANGEVTLITERKMQSFPINIMEAQESSFFENSNLDYDSLQEYILVSPMTEGYIMELSKLTVFDRMGNADFFAESLSYWDIEQAVTTRISCEPTADGSYSISVDGETRTLQCVNEPMGERRPGMRYGLDKKGIYLELTLQFRPYMREDNWVFELNPDQFVASARDKRPEELRRLVFDQRVKLRIEYDGKDARVDTIEFM